MSADPRRLDRPSATSAADLLREARIHGRAEKNALTELLAAVTAPAREDELLGEGAALAEFRSIRADRAAARQDSTEPGQGADGQAPAVCPHPVPGPGRGEERRVPGRDEAAEDGRRSAGEPSLGRARPLSPRHRFRVLGPSPDQDRPLAARTAVLALIATAAVAAVFAVMGGTGRLPDGFPGSRHAAHGETRAHASARTMRDSVPQGRPSAGHGLPTGTPGHQGPGSSEGASANPSASPRSSATSDAHNGPGDSTVAPSVLFDPWATTSANARIIELCRRQARDLPLSDQEVARLAMAAGSSEMIDAYCGWALTGKEAKPEGTVHTKSPHLLDPGLLWH